ncbi:S41 family peptidase [Paenibacillus sp. Marseille-Q7038]
MKKRGLIIILFISLVVFFSYNQTTKQSESIQEDIAVPQAARLPMLTREQMMEDFEYLLQILSENYPFLNVNKRMNGINWVAKEQEYRAKFESVNTMGYFESLLHEIVGDLNNRHTRLITLESYHSLLNVYQQNPGIYKPWIELFEDSVVVQRYNHMSNKQNINPTSTYSYPSVKTVDIDENTAYIKIPTFYATEMKKGLSIITPYIHTITEKNVLIIDIRNNSGGADPYWTTLVEQITSQPITWTSYYLFRKGEYIKPFVESKSGMDFEDLPSLSELTTQNSNIQLGPEMMDHFEKYLEVTTTISPKKSIAYKGKIYVLVNDAVYSSTEKFSVFAKETKWATLVGERTGGDGIGADPVVLKLPNSGFLVSFSLVMGLTSDGSINEEDKTTPHILVDTAETENIHDDPAIKAIMHQKH